MSRILNIQMSVKFLIVIFLLSLLFTSCKKEPYDVLIPVSYERADDVGPMTVKLWVDGNYTKFEWTVDGELLDVAETTQSCELFLAGDDTGISRIKFNGWDADNVLYYGELNLTIPDVATKIEFNGLVSDNIESYIPVSDQDYTVQFLFYDGDDNTLESTTFEWTEAKTDTILFKTSVEYTIEGFDKAVNPEYYIQLSIYKKDETNAFFEKTLYLKEEYYNSRSLYQGLSPISSTESNSEESPMFVLIDWKP